MPRLNVVFITHTHERIARSVMSMAGQTRSPDILIVSCDGDSEKIRAEVARAAGFIDRPVLLVTRPHTGEARPAQTRNNAIRALEERVGLQDDDRLVFFDGDCVAPSNVLAIHEEALQSRELSLGWRIELTNSQTEKLRNGEAGSTFSDIADKHQQNMVRATMRTYLRRNLQRKLGLTKPHKPQVLGANFGVVASTFRAVNGLDETYTGWGMEDDDFGRRVYASGGRPALRLHDCVVLHQHHPTRSTRAWKDNEQAHRLDSGFATVCEHGLENPLPQPEPHVVECCPNTSSAPSLMNG
jgi:N-acetylglucosaminyl-diphospho-decaprenol L-rhamnosyltransferase